MDNDCDGAIDETFDLESSANHCGACGNICAPSNAMGNCQGGECGIGRCEPGFFDVNLSPADGCECAVAHEGEELCNGMDDDCDGAIDEDFHVGNACQVGVGGCARDGVVTCDEQGGSICAGDAGDPQVEACNGVDDGYDGLLDEGLMPIRWSTFGLVRGSMPGWRNCASCVAIWIASDNDPLIIQGLQICGDGLDQLRWS